MAGEPLSLLEFVHELLADAQLRGHFADDPRGTLHAYGLGALSPADVHDALVLAQDNEITDFRAPAWDAGDHADLTDDAFGHGAAVADTGWTDGATGAWDAGAAPDWTHDWSDAGHGGGQEPIHDDADHAVDLGGFGDGADGGTEQDPGWPNVHHG